MITLLSVAMAAPVDVMVEYPFLRTPPVAVRSEVVDPFIGPVQEPVRPQSRWLNGAVGVEVELPDNGGIPLVFGTSLQGFAGRWQVDHLTFDARVFDLQADLGVRSRIETGPEAPLVSPYAAAGAGARVTLFVPDLWENQINPSPQGYASVGLATRGPVRFRTELRARLAARADYYRGRAQLPNEALEWTYRPGGVSLGIQVGIGFDPPRRTRLEPADGQVDASEDWSTSAAGLDP